MSLGVRGEDNEAEAYKAWHKRMAGEQEAKPKRKADRTVGELVKAFLADVGDRAKKNTVRVYRYFLKPFARRYGRAKAADLTPALAEAALGAKAL